MEQHHPRVAGAVLGVLEPVATGLAVEEELADPFGDEHGAQRSRGSALHGTAQSAHPHPHDTTVPMTGSGRRAGRRRPLRWRRCVGVYLPAPRPCASPRRAARRLLVAGRRHLGQPHRPRAPLAGGRSLALGIASRRPAANLTGGRPLRPALAFGLANAAEAVVAGLVLKGTTAGWRSLSPSTTSSAWCAPPSPEPRRGPPVARSTVALGEGPLPETWRYLWTSHAASTLVIVPVAMTWRLRTADRRRAGVAIQVTARGLAR